MARTEMIPTGAAVVVAVSGGQDSCALLHALVCLREEFSLSLHAAHLNHGFRGEAADADAEFVRELCAEFGTPCTIERQDVPAAARRLHISAQEAARRARMAFLERVARSVGADRIAFGHTREDRVETILLNILRGTGTDGLQGLSPIMPVRRREAEGEESSILWRIRPLLTVTREETAAYCRRHGIAFREDASNRSLRYRRNRLRVELLPHIESYYNPMVRDALLRLADIAAEERAYLEEGAREAYDQACREERPDRVVLSTAALRTMPKALQRRVLRRAIDQVRGGLEDVAFAALERALRALQEGAAAPRFQFSLPPGDTYICVTPETCAIARQAAPAVSRPLCYALEIPGETLVPEWSARFRCRRQRCPDTIPAEREAAQVFLDARFVHPPLAVRNRRPGDRMQPLGMAGTRKVQDILTDRKVPVAMRGSVPIVEDAEGILWIVGHAINERARVRPDTGEVVVLEMERGIPPSVNAD
jgi:tRNA(Ile)-lysidine synthase